MYLFKTALENNNDEIVNYMIQCAKEGKFKIRLDSKSEGTLIPFEEDANFPKNILKCAIERGNRNQVKKLIYIIKKDLTIFKDITDTISICKDELFLNFKDIYIDLIKNLSANKITLNLDLTRLIQRHYALTDDSLGNPEWLVLFMQHEHNETFDAISEIKSSYNLKHELKDFDDVKSLSMRMTDKITFKDAPTFIMQVSKLINRYTSDNKSEASVMPWKGAAKIGEEGVLHEIMEKGMEWETCDAKNIKMLIDYKWNTYAKRIMMTQSLTIYLLLLILFSIYCVMLSSTEMEINNNMNFVVMTVILSICTGLSFYKLCEEVIEITRIFEVCQKKEKSMFGIVIEALRTWSYTKWNILECIVYNSITFIIPVLHCVHYYTGGKEIILQSVTTITICFLWWNMFYYLLPYRITGPLIIMIYEIMKDISVFILLVFLITFGFSMGFKLLFSMTSSNELNKNELYEFDTLTKSFLTTFGFMLGGFDLDTIYSSKATYLAIILFVGYMLLMMIMMINLLIAIMSDSYDRIKSKEELSFYIARFQIINDIESKLSNQQIKRIK